MATIREAFDTMNLFSDGLDKAVRDAIDAGKDDVRELVLDQLYSGVNGRDKPLRPTYLNDPWFKSNDAGRWKNNAKGYALWKKKITTPTPSFQGYPARDIYTPNLIITGEFYNSIRVASSDKGLRIETRGSNMGADIERKYGSIILGVGIKSREYIIKYLLNPALRSYFKRFGL